MHVVLLNQPFYPDVVATAQMGKDLADELVRRGHTVTAVASRSIYGQTGAALPKRETIDGIEVRRLGVSIFGKKGIAARVADFALFHALATVRVVTLKKPDVVVSYTTPPFIAVVGLIARLVRGSRAVYWVMDLYPDVPVACGVMKERSLLTRMFERLSRLLLRRSDVSVVLGRCMQERVLSKGIPAEKVKLIPVWADLSGISGVERDRSPYREKWGLGDAFTVMYSGNFGIGHDAATICDAMLRLKDRDDIKWVFVGSGKRKKEVLAFIERHGLKNAQWREYVPREELGLSLAAADVHLISIKEGVEGLVVPSKLLGILAAGRASIYVGSPMAETARVLNESGAGVCVREGEGEKLAAAVLRYKDDPALLAETGARARREIAGKYDMQTATKMWADLLEEVVARKKK
ncbi:MAG: glycosyltransferase family 4 protein [Phycisphaerales bacterium]|nr:glycosyltransferase family 4 protein [Phycisphaerales bacterium]